MWFECLLWQCRNRGFLQLELVLEYYAVCDGVVAYCIRGHYWAGCSFVFIAIIVFIVNSVVVNSVIANGVIVYSVVDIISRLGHLLNIIMMIIAIFIVNINFPFIIIHQCKLFNNLISFRLYPAQCRQPPIRGIVS